MGTLRLQDNQFGLGSADSLTLTCRLKNEPLEKVALDSSYVQYKFAGWPFKTLFIGDIWHEYTEE